MLEKERFFKLALGKVLDFCLGKLWRSKIYAKKVFTLES